MGSSGPGKRAEHREGGADPAVAMLSGFEGAEDLWSGHWPAQARRLRVVSAPTPRELLARIPGADLAGIAGGGPGCPRSLPQDTNQARRLRVVSARTPRELLAQTPGSGLAGIAGGGLGCSRSLPEERDRARLRWLRPAGHGSAAPR